MNLYVWRYNTTTNSYQKTAVIDEYVSIIWITRFYKAGNFELYIPASIQNFKQFTPGKIEILLTRDDWDGAMIVEGINLKTDPENGDYLTVTGRSAESILGRRIIPQQTNFTGTAENCIRSLINQNVINPTNANRKINNFVLGPAQGYTDTIDKQVTGKNLLDTISEICAAYGYGFRVTFDGTNFNFNLYKGTDRSTDQTTNPPVVFSPDYENLGNTEYTYDLQQFKTAVYVAGEGEGSNRKIYALGYTAASDMFRREIWVDSRNTSSTTESGELTPEEYNAIMGEQAKEALRENMFQLDFNGEILNANSYVYGVDYSLGDKVSVINEYGIKGTTNVSEITEVEDESGYKLVPTFSEWSV